MQRLMDRQSAAAPEHQRTCDGVLLAPLLQEHRAAVERLLRETGSFRPEEIVIALEVIDAYLATPDRDYSALGAFTLGGDLVGYVCYGPTPCTIGTFDLYWIAVAPA